jgi:hypothetical protein
MRPSLTIDCSGPRASIVCALILISLAMSTRLGAADDPWVTLPASQGPGGGRHVVLISGDDEYRSEEALPMLGRILAEHHGFRTTVLFAIDPASGEIRPDHQHHIPGMQQLADADVVVLFVRFRELPDEQMRHFVDYFEAGGPIVALRTATHAFFYRDNPSSPYAHYSFESERWPGGFGRQVLGETWVAHHGRHGLEATRGVIEEASAEHPILRGVEDVWGPSDVYSVRDLPPGTEILLRGAVLDGMSPDDRPVAGERNSPMMPVAWVREHRQSSGRSNRIFTTTMGAAVDLESEDLRRLLVNAIYWAAGLEQQIPAQADVSIVGDYEPSFYGFGEYRQGLRPEDFR